MPVIAEKPAIAKPFLKWAGGKSQLLDEIEQRLPYGLSSGEINTYVEPFVGGGAVFFYIAQNYPFIKRFYLLDINQDLVNCYNAVKTNVESVINDLKTLESKFLAKKNSSRKDFYYQIRTEFNTDRSPAKLIFLNKTCYNGLYRVNRNNEFNVPFGGYENPTICDEANLEAASTILKNVDIIAADFEESERHTNKNCFVYLDPPYRPISPTSSFTSYAKDDFTEKDQIRLAEFCRSLHDRGAKFLLSNSDPKNENPNDHFFEKQYKGFTIERVKATRAINCKASGRGEIDELIITNYKWGDQDK
jgi:DNA adenine methylase